MKNPMHAAIESAREGIRKGHGGPFGACIVKQGQIIATAHNTVLLEHDPTCHAEINAIRQACHKLQTHNLSGCVLYATAEPCPMCLSAIYWARIDAMQVGVPIKVAAKAGFDDSRISQELKRPPSRRLIPMRIGVMEASCRKLFEEWSTRQGLLY